METTAIRVKQVRSLIGQSKKTRAIMSGLGLRGIGQTREHKDCNCIRGMVNKVKHLVQYQLVG